MLLLLLLLPLLRPMRHGRAAIYCQLLTPHQGTEEEKGEGEEKEAARLVKDSDRIDAHPDYYIFPTADSRLREKK